MLKIQLLFVNLIMMSAMYANADNQAATLEDGVKAMRMGDKQNAWEILFPIANTGDIQAMFYLGDMMLRSPEYADNLERANAFLSAAAQRGHVGAKALLPQVADFMQRKLSYIPPTIAGTNGSPLNGEIEEANRLLNHYKQNVLQFTESPALDGYVDKVTVMLFSTNQQDSIDNLYRQGQALKTQFGSKITTRYLVRIDPASLRSGSNPIGGVSIPPNGVTPDFQGQLAKQYGLTSLPAAVIIPPNGSSHIVSDISAVSKNILRLVN